MSAPHLPGSPTFPHSALPARQAEEGQCEDNKLGRHVVTIDDYQDVPPNDEKALLKAVANQPVSVAIEADQVRSLEVHGGGWMRSRRVWCGQPGRHGGSAR